MLGDKPIARISLVPSPMFSWFGHHAPCREGPMRASRVPTMVDAGGARIRGRTCEMVDAGGARIRGRTSEMVDAGGARII